MTNELALLILAALWLKTGRGVNLCLLILGYYAVFLASVHLRAAPLDVAAPDHVYMVYIKQSAIDLTFLILCLYLSVKYQNFVGFYGLYAAIIASSLVCNSLMLFDQVIDLHRFYQWHKWRQEIAIPLDLLFAVLGSGGVRISNHDNPYLRTGAGKRYNRSYRN